MTENKSWLESLEKTFLEQRCKQDVDGHWYFCPQREGAMYSSFVLRKIALHLEAKNARWTKAASDAV